MAHRAAMPTKRAAAGRRWPVARMRNTKACCVVESWCAPKLFNRVRRGHGRFVNPVNRHGSLPHSHLWGGPKYTRKVRCLSQDQFTPSSVSADGAMPRSSKFDEPQIAKISSEGNKFAPGAGTPLAKPGFF